MKRFFVILCAASLLLCATAIPCLAAAPETKGKSALLMDAATGTVLYENNSHDRLPPASVTKVMTMLLIMEAIDSGQIAWEDTVTASQTAAAKGGSQVYLKEGETMTVRDMVKSIAVSSANDCACAMAEHLCGSEGAFAEAMNRRAAELGMEDTHFVNCTGLDDGEAAKEHLTSACDIAIMSRELIRKHGDIRKFTTIWMDTVRGGAFGLSNTNKLIRFYPGATGLKTGFTASAGYCLSATAERDGMELIAVVMGCETSADRFTTCKSMLDFGFANYALIRPELPETMTVPVKLGKTDRAYAVPENADLQLIDKSQKNTVTTHYTLLPEITAPVSKGQRLGQAQLKSGEQVLAEIPLVAQNVVEKITFGGLFLRTLRCLCMK